MPEINKQPFNMKTGIISFVSYLCVLLPLVACANNTKIYSLDISTNIQVEIHEETIDSTADKKSMPNGDVVFGATTDPETFVKKIIFSVNNKSYDLESKYMYNAWGNRPLEVPNVIKYFDAYCYDGENCTIRGLFSDAGGAYVAEWKIIKGKATRTVITDSGDIVGMFTKDIAPPVFE